LGLALLWSSFPPLAFGLSVGAVVKSLLSEHPARRRTRIGSGMVREP
jgi:hypothetical protein